VGFKDQILNVLNRANTATGGDALKAMAALAAIGWGSSTIREIAESAATRATEAGVELDRINQRLLEGRAGIEALIAQGDFDTAVLARWEVMPLTDDQINALRDGLDGDGVDQADGPPETIGAVGPDYDDPRTCGTCDQAFPNLQALVDHHDTHIAARRAAANGAPGGQPDVPPRMAGGFFTGAPCGHPDCRDGADCQGYVLPASPPPAIAKAMADGDDRADV
jgi:hypothetical protein